MSNPPGIDLDQLFSRLHTGMRGLQSWRDLRRARSGDIAAAPPTVVAATPSATAPSPHGSLEPQGFVDIGGRLFPVFGDLRPSPAATPTPEPPTPPPAPTAAPPPPSTAAEPPRPTRLNAAVLKMPLPTPPACLARATTPPADDDAEPAEAPRVEQAGPATPRNPAPPEAVPERRSDTEATRLEQVHAEHRALLATLLGEHRAQLADQAEAAARREQQILRDLLAEHRAELEAHTDAMRQLLTRHREDVQKIVAGADQTAEHHARAITGLHELLAEQAKRQAQSHEQTEQHIGDLAAALGDLGQTVGQLAAATFERKRDPAPTLLLPPQLGASVPVPVMPWPPSPPTPTAGTPVAASTPRPDLPPSPARTIEPPPSPAPPADLAPPSPTSSPNIPPARMPRHEPSHAQSRVAALVDEFDDDDLQDVDDPDDPPPHARLSPITPLERFESSEPAHG